MRTWGLAGAVVVALVLLAVVGLSLRSTPGGTEPVSSTVDLAGASDTADDFWSRARDGDCFRAARLVWAPVARRDQQTAFAEQCRDQDGDVDSVDLGDARIDPAADIPYGAQAVVAVPVTVHRGDASDDQLLRMVQVRDRWFVML